MTSVNVNAYASGDAIGVLRDYLGESVVDDGKLDRMSNQIYDKYVLYDDEVVIRAIRRVMIIYAQYTKRLMHDGLMKWRLNSMRNSLLLNSYSDNRQLCLNQNYKRQNEKKKDQIMQKNKYKPNRIMTVKRKEMDQLLLHKIQITNEVSFTIRNNNTKRKRTEKRVNRLTRMTHTSPNQFNHNDSNTYCYFPLKYINNQHQRLHKNYESLSNKKCKNHNHSNQIDTYNNKLIRPIYKSTLSKEEKEKLFISLYNDSKARKEKLNQMNIEKENKFQSEYTFIPQLQNNRSQSSSHYNTAPFFERLNFYDQNKRNHLQRICQDLVESQPKDKQKPHQNQLSKSPEKQHLNTNGKDYRKAQREKRRRIEQMILEEQGVTFKPILNNEINHCIPNTVIERNKEFIMKKEAKLTACRDEPDKNCTFKPTTNTNCIEASSFRNTDPNGGDNQIGNRLYQYQSKYLQNLELKKKEYEEVYPFKPTISKNTDNILYHKQMIMEEIKKKHDNRLLHVDNHNRDILEEPSQNETEGNNNNTYAIKNNNLNINTITSENNSVSNSPMEKEKKMRIEDTDNDNNNQEREMIAVSTAKCDHTSQKKTKVTSSNGNMSDERLIELAQNYDIEMDGNAFDMKLANKNYSNTIEKKNKPIAISKENEYDIESDIYQNQQKAFMKNLKYYDNLK